MQDRVFALGPLHFPTSAFTQGVCNVALLHCFLPSLVSRWRALLCWAVCRTWFGLVVMSTQQLPSAAGSAHLPYTHRWCKDMKVTWMTSWVEQTYQEDLDEIKDDNLMGYNMTPIYWMQGKNFQKFFFFQKFNYLYSLLYHIADENLKLHNPCSPFIANLRLHNPCFPFVS